MTTLSVGGFILLGLVLGIVVLPRIQNWVRLHQGAAHWVPTCSKCSKAILDWDKKGMDLGHDLGLCLDCQSTVNGSALIAEIERLIAHDQKLVDERSARIGRLKERLADLKRSSAQVVPSDPHE